MARPKRAAPDADEPAVPTGAVVRGDDASPDPAPIRALSLVEPFFDSDEEGYDAEPPARTEPLDTDRLAPAREADDDVAAVLSWLPDEPSAPVTPSAPVSRSRWRNDPFIVRRVLAVVVVALLAAVCVVVALRTLG